MEEGNAFGTPCRECREQHFGIPLRLEWIIRQTSPHFRKIVHLPVEHDHIATGCIMKRLVGGTRQVDDGKPSMPEGDAFICIETFGIGPPVEHGITHLPHRFRMNGSTAFRKNSSYATHIRKSGMGFWVMASRPSGIPCRSRK